MSGNVRNGAAAAGTPAFSMESGHWRRRRMSGSLLLFVVHLLLPCAPKQQVVASSEEATMISIETLREKYSYNPETGELTSKRLNSVVGHSNRNRRTAYIRVKVLGSCLLGHRVAWAMHYGEWPKGQIDHRDGDGMNNRIDNLRDSSHAQNQRNQRLHARNKTGVRGVSVCKRTGKLMALIWDGNGKRIYIGRFETIEAAAAARKEAELKYWAE